MNFYLTLDEQGRPAASPYPEMDGETKDETSGAAKVGGQYLRPGIPLYDARRILAKLPERQAAAAQVIKALKRAGIGAANWRWQDIFPAAEPDMADIADMAGIVDVVAAESMPNIQIQNITNVEEAAVPADTLNTTDTTDTTNIPNATNITNITNITNTIEANELNFRESVRGRRLSESEIRKLAAEKDRTPEEVRRSLHRLVLRQEGEWLPAVSRERQGWRCRRCGGRNCQEWPAVYGLAATCLDCRSLGAVTSLQAIYQDQRRISPPQGEIRFSPNRELTEAQAQAAREVLSFVQGEQGRMLLWAACGAGKTEVCFPALAWALREGRSVLLAAPRQDVIHDIAPRLQQDFPDLPLQVLTGSSETRFDVGGLVLATTHQVLRFARVFDLVILDEVDAFPYADNEALRWGMENSLRQDGKMLYLTATPAAEQLAGVKKGELSLVRLPARHHRQPVPVPVWERWPLSGDEKDQRACPPKLQEKVRQLAEKGTVLLFVPKISLVESWAEIMRRCFPDWPVDGSYSQDPQRQMKISALKNQAYRIFISTLILERGVTINGVQVIVLAADHPIFDERSLVQMAGRAGRTTEQPQGSVYYFAKRMTAAMKTAVRQIEEQNAIALAKNLIDAGGENDPTSSARGEEMASVDLV